MLDKVTAKFYIPDKLPECSLLDASMKRFEYIQQGMFAFVSWRWVNPFVKWIGGRKCLEVMSGRGILSYALRQKGVDVIATDNYSLARNSDSYFSLWREPVTEVEDLDAVDAVRKYGRYIDILIMSWPGMDSTAYYAIKKLYKINPNALVVYIGEGRGGCTADDNFFDHFEEIEDSGFEPVVESYQRWPGIYDSPCLGRYKD